MKLAARLNNRLNSWVVYDKSGQFEIDTAVYDTQAEAEADFPYYEGIYGDPDELQAQADEEAHDMPLHGQDHGDMDLTAKAASSLNVPVGVSGAQRTAYLALSDEDKAHYRFHFIAMGQPAATCLHFTQVVCDCGHALAPTTPEGMTLTPTVADWAKAKQAAQNGDTRPVRDIAFESLGTRRTWDSIVDDVMSRHVTAARTELADLARDITEAPLSLWLLHRNSGLVDPGEMDSCVVAAESADTARQTASDARRDEHAGSWWLPSTTCIRVGTAMPGQDTHLIHASLIED